MSKRVLIIKTSSLGDILHTFAAISDACQAISNLRFDWIVEESFKTLPTLHPSVDTVFPVAIRRWRRTPLQAWRSKEIHKVVANINAIHYDCIIDAQGLLKSALLARYIGHNNIKGACWHSARDRFASLFYKQRYTIPPLRGNHAVTRLRSLFAQALEYSLPDTLPQYGLQHLRQHDNKQEHNKQEHNNKAPYLLFLHGTSWQNKHWPDKHWHTLATLAGKNNWPVKILWGSECEKKRAYQLAEKHAHISVLPRMPLHEVAPIIAQASGAVAVDTGLGHMAAALHTPCISLYGPTSAKLTGAYGPNQQHISATQSCAPCLKRKCKIAPNDKLPPCMVDHQPQHVWQQLQLLLAKQRQNGRAVSTVIE